MISNDKTTRDLNKVMEAIGRGKPMTLAQIRSTVPIDQMDIEFALGTLMENDIVVGWNGKYGLAQGWKSKLKILRWETKTKKAPRSKPRRILNPKVSGHTSSYTSQVLAAFEEGEVLTSLDIANRTGIARIKANRVLDYLRRTGKLEWVSFGKYKLKKRRS